jgi:hypothetical protein
MEGEKKRRHWATGKEVKRKEDSATVPPLRETPGAAWSLHLHASVSVPVTLMIVTC